MQRNGDFQDSDIKRLHPSFLAVVENKILEKSSGRRGGKGK